MNCASVLKKIILLNDIIKAKFTDDLEFLKICMLHCRVCMGMCNQLPRKVQLLQLLSFGGTMALNCFGTIISFVNVTDAVEKLQIVFVLSIHVACFLLCIHFKFHAKKLWHLFHQPFDEYSSRYIGKEGIIIASKLSKQLIIVCTLIFTGLVVTSTIVTFLTMIFLNLDEIRDGDAFISTIPYWFYCGNSPRVRMCCRIRNYMELSTVNVIQLVCLFYEVNLCLSIMYMFIIITCGIEARARIFRLRLSSLAAQMPNLVVFRSYLVRKEFRKIILHQKAIRRFMLDFRPYMNFPMLLHIWSFFALTILAAFMFVKKGDVSILIRIKGAYFAILGSIFHFIICKTSMSTSNMNENLLNSMMDFPWYEYNVKFQKSYLIMLSMNQKPMDLKLYGWYHVDLLYFASNMRRIYSLLNVLLLRQF